jgi:hypothetical protein
MAATSFNGTTATIGGTAVLVQSISIAGGDTAMVDVTASSSGRRLQIAGLNEPRTITITGLAETVGWSAGNSYNVVIASNTPMAATYTSWLCMSLEITGNIDEANTFTTTFLEDSDAT